MRVYGAKYKMSGKKLILFADQNKKVEVSIRKHD